MNRRWNLEVFDDTLRIARQDGRKGPSRFESIDRVRKLPPLRERRFRVHVTQNDYIDDARFWALEKGKRVLLGNSASLKNPGGGVTRGSKAAEEELCRRSDLFLALERVDQELKFPLHGRTVGIGVPGVTVFKQSADAGYSLEFQTFGVDVVCLFSRPKSHLKQSSFDYHCGAWQPAVHFANQYRSEVLVLPPMGCGVFGNDPADVARALERVLANFQLETVEEVVISCFRNADNHAAFSWALRDGLASSCDQDQDAERPGKEKEKKGEEEEDEVMVAAATESAVEEKKGTGMGAAASFSHQKKNNHHKGGGWRRKQLRNPRSGTAGLFDEED